MIQKYGDLFVEYLRDHERKGEAFDITFPLTCTTFDVITELAFGESFHVLKNGQSHPFVTEFSAP